MIDDNDEDIESPYCPVCGSCGDNGCCSPEKCTEGAGCLYPGFSKRVDMRLPAERVFESWYAKNKGDYKTLNDAKRAFLESECIDPDELIEEVE